MFEEKDMNLLETTAENIKEPLPLDHLELVSGWGNAQKGLAYVYRPANLNQLRQVLRLAQVHGRSVGLRGGGNSYGDAAMNDEQIVLDMRRMNRILEWDPQNGRLRLEPGVTLQRVWEYTIEDGWWLPVATGTQKITVGGGAAMNVHGKNAWKMGTFGDHIFEFELMLANGEIVTCNREENEDLFHAAIGGCGLLGIFTAITITLKKVHSGLIWVEAAACPNLGATLRYFEEYLPQSDYLVSWLDAFSKGKRLGRSEMHRARYLVPGEDPNQTQTLSLANQVIPPEIMGFFPRSVLWRFQRPFWNNFGMRLVNTAKYSAARLKHETSYLQPHVIFHFLLDSLDWRKPFGPGGLIQYQPFVPADKAESAFAEILTVCQKRGLPNFLTVMKRHRPDPFLLSHGLDGYSLAMDFKITRRNKQRMVALTRELDEIVLAAGGRFYFAKDSTLRPHVVKAAFGEELLAQFYALKTRCDPGQLLQTNMWRRLFCS